jgi:hypothetical protein
VNIPDDVDGTGGEGVDQAGHAREGNTGDGASRPVRGLALDRDCAEP